MSQRKVQPIIHPSSVVKEDLKDIKVQGNACLSPYSLARMVDFYTETSQANAMDASEDELEECAQALITLVRNHTGHSVGPLTSESKPNKQTVSGLFAAQLQHLFSSFLFPGQGYIPDILVATQQKLKSGGIDATVYKRIGHSGLHPRVLFEFTVDDTNKESQLFSYANNASTVIGNDIHLLMTGCVITMHRDRPADCRLQVFTYEKVRPPPEADKNGDGARIAAIPIYNGAWNVETITRLLRMVRGVLTLSMSDYDLPDGDLLPYDRIRQNVLIVDNVVYKIYDYRATGGAGDCRPNGNILFLGAKAVVRDACLCVISYPLVEGDHIAELAVDFVGVLLHLRDVHAAGQLHMDIKLGNVIFNHTSGAASRLIDFDYCGPTCNVRYPARYNHDISDGKRHKDAVAGNRGLVSHDFYAMMGTMRLFKPSEDTLASRWDEWTTRVGQGQLVEVAKELAEQGSAIELVYTGMCKVVEPTDSPPQRTSACTRKRGLA